jgi:hypothetical protein
LAAQVKPNSIHTGGGHYDQSVKLTLKAADSPARIAPMTAVIAEEN